MSKSSLMGDEIIGSGVVWAGVQVISGYPGTPSTEVLEMMAKYNPRNVYVEWSVDGKAGMGVAAAAAYTGARTMVTVKWVGLNVASDPLMGLAYVGVKGGMVIVAADDPGPISSQTGQDMRRFGQLFRSPVFDPSSPEKAYEMTRDALEYSEKYHAPVLFCPITRLCHGYVNVELRERVKLSEHEGFVKDSGKWIIFPRLSRADHRMIETRSPMIGEDFSSYRFNLLHKGEGNTVRGILTHGINHKFVMKTLGGYKGVRVFRVSTPSPIPERLLLEFTKGLDEAIAVEELGPVLERGMLLLSNRHHLPLEVKGKLTGEVQPVGRNSVESVRRVLEAYLGGSYIQYLKGLEDDATDPGVTQSGTTQPEISLSVPPLSVHSPVLCAGYPHRASFYVIKRAIGEPNEDLEEDTKPIKGIYCGNIGCYTLGNAKPLDMVDTCLCMGAGITMARGLQRVELDKRYFSFVGDSALFASGFTDIVDAVYNEASLTLRILDSSTTAMIGHQPHPDTGRTMTGSVVEKVDITKVLEGIDVKSTVTVDTLDLDVCVEAVLKLSAIKDMEAVIFKSSCVAITRSSHKCRIIKDSCVNCRTCINEIGYPALVLGGDMACIDSGLYTGCNLCSQICSISAIETVKQSCFKRTGQRRCLENEVYEVIESVLLCGVGGQGIVLTSRLITLVAMEKGMETRGAETIGMAQRGGGVMSHVRIGKKIYSPLMPHGGVDVFIGFEPAEVTRCLPYLKRDGCVVISPVPIRSMTVSLAGGGYTGLEVMEYLEHAAGNLVTVDVASIGMACGSPKAVDVTLLGATITSGLIGISLGGVEAIIERRVSGEFKDMNMKALKLGASTGPMIK